MRTSSILALILLACAFVVSSYSKGTAPIRKAKGGTFTLTIQITNIRNSKGRIQLHIYRDQDSFSKEVPWKSTNISKSRLKGNVIVHRISGFKSGVYGLALLDDENSNTKMDYGWVMPKEGFGFSDYYHTAWSKPKFKSFKFYMSADKTVKMRIRYI